MARYTAHAFVVGVHNWGEADKIVQLFTAERGRIKAAAFGCRRPKSALAASLQMFNEIEVELTEGQRLDTVRTASIVHHPRKLAEDLMTMAYGSFVAECVTEFLTEKQSEPAVYDVLHGVFAAFETRNPRVTALVAAFQLMEFTGLQLSYTRCTHCGKRIEGDAYFLTAAGGALCTDCCASERQEALPYPAHVRAFIASALAFDWKEQASFVITKQDLLAAEGILIGYLHQLLGHPLKSLAFIQKL